MRVAHTKIMGTLSLFAFRWARQVIVECGEAPADLGALPSHRRAPPYPTTNYRH